MRELQQGSAAGGIGGQPSFCVATFYRIKCPLWATSGHGAGVPVDPKVHHRSPPRRDRKAIYCCLSQSTGQRRHRFLVADIRPRMSARPTLPRQLICRGLFYPLERAPFDRREQLSVPRKQDVIDQTSYWRGAPGRKGGGKSGVRRGRHKRPPHNDLLTRRIVGTLELYSFLPNGGYFLHGEQAHHFEVMNSVGRCYDGTH